MDEARIEAEGIKPLLSELARVEKIRSLKDFQMQVARMHSMGVRTLFFFDSAPDLKNSSMVIGFAGQGGLSLPNRDYYTKTDERSQQLREEFRKHVTRMFELVGDSPEKAAANANAVIAIETRSAREFTYTGRIARRNEAVQQNGGSAAEGADAELFVDGLSRGDRRAEEK